MLDIPDYRQYQTQAYVRDKDPLWKTDTRYKRAEIERAVFYHCYQVGTPQVLSNKSGEQVWAVTLDTWGQTLKIKASDHLLEQTNIRFQGQYHDQETGLHYNRYRYYEPHSARYIGKDPIGLDGGINTSAYVRDPNAWVDPMGLAGKTEKRPYWLMSDAEIKAQQNLNQVKALAQRPNVASGRHSALIANAKVQTGTTKSSNQAAQRQRNNLTPPSNTRPASAGLIGNLLPSHAAPFAKSQELSRTLQMQGAIRNDNLAAVATAGYAPYAVAGAVEGGTAIAPVIGRAAAPYIGSGAALDGAGFTACWAGRYEGTYCKSTQSWKICRK